MGKKLYVGGLPYSTTQEELNELFASAGTVEEATIIMDRETQRSKGFGFVTMSTDEEAAAAAEQFNGSDFGGRKLTVNEARPREDRPAFGGGQGGFNRGPRY